MSRKFLLSFCAALVVCGALTAVLLASWQEAGPQGNETSNGLIYAKASPKVAEVAPFPEDIAEVERKWGEPIPDELIRIGGVDQWSWAQVWRDPLDPPGLFHGAFRDRLNRYEGPLRLVGTDFDVLGPTPLRHFYMTSVDSGGVNFTEAEAEPPSKYFTLEPINRDAWIMAHP